MADVAVVIPTRGKADLLNGCLTALFKTTKDIDLEVVVVEHGDLLQYIPPATTIWRSHTKEEDAYQVRILNSFLK